MGGPIKPGVNRPKPHAGLAPGFNQDYFSELIQGNGLTFRWSRAVECPCRLNAHTDQPDPTCDTCQGDGWWYVNPDQKIDRHTNDLRDYLEAKCAFSSARIGPSLETMGWHPHGHAQITVQGSMRVGFRDRFIGMEQELPYTELITRTMARDTVPIGRTGRARDDQRTAMRYEPVRIDFVGAASGVRYFEGEDWVLTQETIRTPAYPGEPRKLQWLPTKGPIDGVLFTVHYVCRPVWVVEEWTYAVQHLTGPLTGIIGQKGRQDLPTTVAVGLDHIVQARGT